MVADFKGLALNVHTPPMLSDTPMFTAQIVLGGITDCTFRREK